MDPVIRVREYLLDNVGHMTYPGNGSFDARTQQWHVPVFCRSAGGSVVVGDVELDEAGHIVFAPSREDMLARLARAAAAMLVKCQLPDATKERVEDLIRREKNGGLSEEETAELNNYLHIEHVMRLAKARARRFLPREL